MIDAKGGDIGGSVNGSSARHARVQVSAEAPLTFWSFLPIVADRKVSIAAAAVAGMSAPLCTACAIQPIAVAARNSGDTTDFGFTILSRYTLAYVCNGNPAPSGLAGAPAVVQYLLLNRLDPNPTVFTDEQSQLFRIGAQNLPGSAQQSQACFTVNNPEQVWADRGARPVLRRRPARFRCLAALRRHYEIRQCVAVAVFGDPGGGHDEFHLLSGHGYHRS